MQEPAFIDLAGKALPGGEDDQEPARIDSDRGECPTAFAVLEPVSGQVDGKVVRVEDFDPVRVVALSVGKGAVRGGHELVEAGFEGKEIDSSEEEGGEPPEEQTRCGAGRMRTGEYQNREGGIWRKGGDGGRRPGGVSGSGGPGLLEPLR